jgi:DNA-binding PadR family transcriptional regulator
MDELFGRLLPSASQEQVESSRLRVLERVRSDVAAGRQSGEAMEWAGSVLNYGDYHILLALAEGERHGYAIMSEVEDITEGATKFGPGTLYTSIGRLLDAGLIGETECRPDPRMNDEPRQYYKLTGIGQRVLTVESERLAAQRRHGPLQQVVRCL